MAQQRRFRNANERDVVCRGVLEEAAKLGLPLDSGSMVALVNAMDRYASMDETQGQEIRGRVSSEEIRPGSVIEYVLPSRRIAKPMVRITTAAASTHTRAQ
jgi:hypothetical protein